MPDEVDDVFAAMQQVYGTLKPLNPGMRKRVLDSVTSLLDIPGIAAPHSQQVMTEDEDNGDTDTPDKNLTTEAKFETFAEMFDAVDPQTNPDRALVAAYWVQVHAGADNFDAYSVNKSLKDLGHGIANVTDALKALKSRKPALVLQVRKSGKGKKGRITYKLTTAGIKATEAMFGG